MKPQLYILIGCPGSGKTTWVKKNIKDTDRHISRDLIRFSLVSEDEEYFSRENEVWQKYLEAIMEELRKGNNVYADSTNLNKKARRKLLNGIKEILPMVDVNAVYIKVPLVTALKRNMQRNGREYVPETAIFRMFNSIEEPEIEEGFNYILTVEDL